MLATEPGHSATVDVAFAGIGRTPVNISAGKDIKLPPPATEFSIPASVAAENNSNAFGMVIGWVGTESPTDQEIRTEAAGIAM